MKGGVRNVFLTRKKNTYPKGMPNLGIELNHFFGISFNKKTYFL